MVKIYTVLNKYTIDIFDDLLNLRGRKDWTLRAQRK
jgi:hypothetical protein